MLQFMDYNLTSSRQTAPLMMIKLYRILAKMSEKNIFLENADIFTIGWLIEMVKSFILVTM